MELKIGYKDNSTRVIKVHPDFFENTKIKDRYKEVTVTPQEKALDIAADTGQAWDIVLIVGAEERFRHQIRQNKPESVEKEEAWHEFMSKSNVIYEDIRRMKKEVFTKRWNPRLEPVLADKSMSGYEKGVHLLLDQVN